MTLQYSANFLHFLQSENIGLSDGDPTRASCKHDHSETYEDCQNLFFCFQSTVELIEDNVKGSLTKEQIDYESKVATSFILEWMKHIIREVYTQEAK